MDKTHLVEYSRRTYRNGAVDVGYKVEYRNSYTLDDILTSIISIVDAQPNDLIRIIFSHVDLSRPVVYPLQLFSKTTPSAILSRVEHVLSSHATLTVDSNLNIIVGVIHMSEIQLSSKSHSKKKKLLHEQESSTSNNEGE